MADSYLSVWDQLIYQNQCSVTSRVYVCVCVFSGTRLSQYY